MRKITLLLIALLFGFLSFAQYSVDDTQNYTFTDISTTGTSLNLADDGMADITTPFYLQLGNTLTNELRIGNNGAILFNTTTDNLYYENSNLATSSPMISPFWDDFDSEMGNVYYKTTTANVGGMTIVTGFIVQWNLVHYNGSTNSDIASFQVKFSPFNTNIVFIYADTDMDGTNWDYGASATIGISTADKVTEYSFNQAIVGPGSLVGITTLIFSEQKSTIDDDAFENYLETHNFEGYSRNINDNDTMGDGIANNNLVLTRKIMHVTELNINGLGIASLTENGELNDFESLIELNCNDNNLTGTLNFSSNIHLNKIQCKNNDLTSIVTTDCTYLNYFDCSHNENLIVISIVDNGYLQTLNISNTNISKIDDTDGDGDDELKFEHHPLMQSISAANIGYAKSIDTRYLESLINLNCSDNLIELIYLPQNNSHLKTFYMTETHQGQFKNEIFNLPNSTALEELWIGGKTKIGYWKRGIIGGDTNIEWGLLDLSNCVNLKLLWIDENTAIEKIDLRNGANASIVSGGFNITDNQLLHCVYVDDVAYAQSHWNNYKDYGTSFVANESACENRLVYVPDDAFEHYLETHNDEGVVKPIGSAQAMGNGIDNDNYVFAKRIEEVKMLGYAQGFDIENLGITDLIGLGGFTALENFQLSEDNSWSYSHITSLDFSHNLWLEYINIIDTEVASIDVSNNKRLTELYCKKSELTSIDVTQNEKLWILDISNNLLSSVDVTQNEKLNYFDLYNNQITSIDVSQNIWLKRLNCSNNILGSLNINMNDQLEHLECANTDLLNLDISQNLNLDILVISDNQISNLDVTQHIQLVNLNCANNQLSNLNINAQVDLKKLNCATNQLTSLDLTHNFKIREIDCSTNQITSLNLDNLDGSGYSYKFNANNNELTELYLRNGLNNKFTGVYQDDDGNNISRFRVQNNPNLTCIYVDNATDANNSVNDYVAWQKDATATYVETTAECNALDNVSLQVKVFLQGPLLNPNTAGLMNDDLRSLDYLPTTSPYGDGITTSGVFDDRSSLSVIDWVWVELRDTSDNIVASKSALLQRNGHVVDMGLNFGLTFNVSPANYYVVIKHRNHLGVMSANPIALSSTTTVVDFTDSNFSTYGNNAQVQLASGDMALWAGDTNNNKQIKFSGSANDSNVIKDAILADSSNGFHAVTFTSTGYLLFDVDMNGSGKFSGSGNDSNITKDNVLSHPSNGFGSPTYSINTTIPIETLLRRVNTNNNISNIYLPPSEKVRLENEKINPNN